MSTGQFQPTDGEILREQVRAENTVPGVFDRIFLLERGARSLDAYKIECAAGKPRR